MIDENMLVVKVLLVISFCGEVIVLGTLAGMHSVAAGVCMLLLSMVPFIGLLVKFGVIPISVFSTRKKLVFGSFVLLAVLGGMSGGIMNPDDAFYWASFTWAALGLIFLVSGIYFDLYGPECVYSYYFFPVYKLSKDSRRVVDATFEASSFLIFLLMLAIWALWCALCVDPDPAVIVFVITWLYIIVYV